MVCNLRRNRASVCFHVLCVEVSSIFVAPRMNKSHKKRKSKCSKSRSQSVTSDVQSDQQKEEQSIVDYIKLGPTFSIRTSKLMGRYMVAAKDLRPGSVILSELPLIVGPCSGCKVQCIGCYQVLEEDGYYKKCDKCGWPLCSQKCPGLGKLYGHKEPECAVLRECKSGTLLNYTDFSKLKESFNAIVPLRCLIMKESDPKKYEQILAMEAHNEIRRGIPEIWNLDQIGVVDRIRKQWGLKEFSEQEIHNVCGILEVNSFEIGQQGVNIRGLYPTAFLMSHDCVPNTSHSDEEKDYRLTVRASICIPESYPVTLSYAYTLQSTLKRREHLLENKFFECQCKRCKDSTELGTYAGALRCPKCQTGLVLSTKPLDPEASWSCDNVSLKPEAKCPGYTVTANSMELLTSRISAEVDAIDCNDIKNMEIFLQKYRNVLHPTHHLCLGVKLSLSQLYGKINGYLIDELSEELLRRKMDVCKEIMKIFDVVEPGYTRIRGVTLYELHAPVMILTSRQFENQLISKSQLKQKLKEVVRYLEEASVILGFEPENSSEGIMSVAAKEALLKIKDWEKIIGKL